MTFDDNPERQVQMDYTKILTRSFEIVRMHRALWLFGILLALFGGGGGGGGGFPGVPGAEPKPNGGPPFKPPVPSFDFNALVPILIAIGCIIVILALVGIVLRFVSRGALIGLVHELQANQTTPTIGRGFRIGFSRFWSLLAIAILINLPLLLFSLLLIGLAALPIVGALLSSAGRQGLEGIIAAAGITSVLIFCCVILFLVLLALVIQPFYEFMQRACVVGNHGAMDSIREGFRLVRANLGNVLVLYILAIAIGIGFGIVMIPIAIVLFAVLFGAAFGAYLIANSLTPAIVVAVVIAIPVVLILVFVSGLYRAFESTFWTEGYLAVANK